MPSISRDRILLSLSLLVTGALCAEASDPVLCQGRILIDPLAAAIVNTAHCPGMNATKPDLQPSNRFMIAPREVITLGVANTNPLVFTYKWNGITLTETPDFKAAAALAGSLQKIGSGAGALGFDASAQASPNAAIESARDTEATAAQAVEAAARNVATAEAALTTSQQTATRSALALTTARKAADAKTHPEETARVKAELERAEVTSATADSAVKAARAQLGVAQQMHRAAQQLAEVAHAAVLRAEQEAKTDDPLLRQIEDAELKAAIKTTGLTLVSLDETEAAIAALAAYVTKIPSLVEATLKDAERQKAKDEVAGWDLDTKAEAIRVGLVTVGKAQATLDEFVQRAPSYRRSAAWLRTTLDHVNAQEAKAQRLLEEARRFAAAMARVGEPITFGETVSYDAAHYAKASITVGYADGGSDLVKRVLPSKVDRATGTFTITFEPYNPVALGIGLSGVYVFSKGSDGKTIGWRPVATLTVAPSKWADYLLTPHLELGVTPETDKIGFYFGAGVQIKWAFKLVGGLTLQQTKTGGGSSYKPGGYMGFLVDLDAKK